MARKVFISFLGTSNYGECMYASGDYCSKKVKYIQEATLEFIGSKKWNPKSVAYILLTNDAEAKNWNDNGHKDKEGHEIMNQGLKTRLNLMNLPFEVLPLCKLPNGNNEEEIWTIFKRVFEKIEEGDELYFDLTHGFRYLPMLTLVLGNYSKFLKNVTVKSITYGNFESRENDIAPIIDVTPLSRLQDWTYAAGQYLDSGNVKKMVELKSIVRNEKLNCIIDALETVIKERQTCRGKQIHTSENLSVLRSALSDYLSTKTDDNPEEEPLHHILKKVDSSLKDFDTNTNFMNGFNASKWCAKNGLFQQAITMLRENFITFFCERHGFDIMNKDMRGVVECALNIQVNKNHNNRDKWPIKINGHNISEQDHILIESVLKDEYIKPTIELKEGKEKEHNTKLIHVYQDIREYRNNFNHAGFNEGTPNPKEIEEKVNEFVTRTLELFAKVN